MNSDEQWTIDPNTGRDVWTPSQPAIVPTGCPPTTATKINGRWWRAVPPAEVVAGDRIVYFDRGFRHAVVRDRRRRTIRTRPRRLDGITVDGRNVRIDAITQCWRRGR